MKRRYVLLGYTLGAIFMTAIAVQGRFHESLRPASARRPSAAASLDWPAFRSILDETRTRPEFLRRLKAAYPIVFTQDQHLLVHQTESPCVGEAPPERPRILQFEPETGFHFAYTGGESGLCSRQIEVLIPESQTTYKIYFSEDGSKAPRVFENRVSCTVCHGAKPYLMGIYNFRQALWPRFYGSNSSQLKEGSDEARDYAEFIRKNSLKEPYSLLEGYAALGGSPEKLERGSGPVQQLFRMPGAPDPAGLKSQLVVNKNALSFMDHALPGAAHSRSLLAEIQPIPADQVPQNIRGRVPESCVECHVSEPRDGFYIPFDKPELMIPALRLANGALYRAIMESVETEDPDLRMPPKRALSQEEVDAMREYLDSLSGK